MAHLIVEGKVGNINFTGELEDAGRDLGNMAVAIYHEVYGIGGVEVFIRTENYLQKTRFRWNGSNPFIKEPTVFHKG